MNTTPTNPIEKAEGNPAWPEAAPAWELLEAGRYRPRRIRGSYRGRELG
jgi:hypothetical protein